MSKATDTQNNNDQHDAKKSPAQLEREVEEARARLGKTANELSDRFSPGEFIDQALGMAREHGGEFGRNLSLQVKHNPMPMILTSVGVSWLMMSSKSGAAQAHHTQGKGTNKHGQNIKDALGNTAAKSRDKAAAMGDRMHDASTNAKASVQNARESLADFYRDQPLLAGSLGIAIGAALGALVPSTELEDEKFGEARDRRIDKAKSKAAEKYDEVRESARQK